jgi:folate-dependent phosphoribosylglycinamide formyltransferase PurN
MKIMVMALHAGTPLIRALQVAGFAPVVVQECRTSPQHLASFYGRRLRKAPVQVLGEVAYQVFKLARPAPAVRVEPAAPPALQVKSINEEACLRFVRETRPDIVFLDGTSIARQQLIETVRPGRFCNIHCGITPAYRGSGNPYALIRGDLARLGVTFHEVDAGIDTGAVIGRKHVPLEAGDTGLLPYQMRCYQAGVRLVEDWLQQRPVTDDFAGRPLDSVYYPQLTLRSYLQAERALKRLRPA